MTTPAGGYYHIYNRGSNRDPIFLSDDNYLYLLKQIKRLLPTSAIIIVAYCLMPNHYHFLLRAESVSAASQFIRRLFISYTQAFNRQHRRSGTLFEGRAKRVQIDGERYAIHLCRYIHLNPVVSGLVSAPEDWSYSNYLEWAGKRGGTLWDRDLVQQYFPKPQDYEKFIHSSIENAMAAKIKRYLMD